MLVFYALAPCSIIVTCKSSPTCELTRAHDAQGQSEHQWRLIAILKQPFRLSEKMVTGCTRVVWVRESGAPIRIATGESCNSVCQNSATMVGFPTLEVAEKIVSREDVI